jgi:uncharacterized protein YceK
MKNIFFAFITALLFLGCSSNATPTDSKPLLVINQTLSYTLNDQFEKSHTLSKDTKTVVFAFSKKGAHSCNAFFNAQKPTYLEEHNAEFVADVSAAPSLIRSFFILPGLKEFKHTVLLLDDENVAKDYRIDMDTESIVVVELKDGVIQAIKNLKTAEELQKEIER